MKTLKIWCAGLTMLSIALAGCSKDDTAQPVSYTEDGFYVVGEATAVADLAASDADKALMAAGIDENGGQEVRAGMYEKYVALEGGKPFSIVKKAGAAETAYGATLALSETLSGDNEPAIQVYKGALAASGAALQVAESGLYHVVLDVELEKIMVAPVEWGMRGAMNNWGFTPLAKPAFSKTAMKYTADVVVYSGGGFKFAYGGGWKIELNPDEDPLVKANTNLGNDGGEDNDPLTAKVAPGGKNIGIERGYYRVELAWTLAKGAIKDGYTATVTKTSSEEPVMSYADCELELVGNGVDESNAGAQPDLAWEWGHVLSAGKPAVNGTVYTWTWSSVLLKTDGFKIRTINAEDSGGVTGFDVGKEAIPDSEGGGDIVVAEAGSYDIVFTINAAEDTRELTITKQ